MFLQKARRAYRERQWGSLITYGVLAVLALFVSFFGLDRLGEWGNQKMDEGATNMMPDFFSILAWEWFPVVAMFVLIDIAAIGFVILYKRAGRLTTSEEEKQPKSKGTPDVAVQMVAKAIREQASNTQQLVEELQPKELTESEEWWKQYRPSCVIVKVDYLKITKGPNVYHFELPIDVKYTSRDSRHSTGMDCTTILLNVFHAGKDREQKPYILRSSTMPRRIEPLGEFGGFKVIQPKWDLPINPPWVVTYTFIGEVEVVPLVDEETSCIITHIGIPRIYNVNINKPLKIEDSKFPISVIDGKFLVKIDKQNY